MLALTLASHFRDKHARVLSASFVLVSDITLEVGGFEMWRLRSHNILYSGWEIKLLDVSNCTWWCNSSAFGKGILLEIQALSAKYSAVSIYLLPLLTCCLWVQGIQCGTDLWLLHTHMSILCPGMICILIAHLIDIYIMKVVIVFHHVRSFGQIHNQWKWLHK